MDFEAQLRRELADIRGRGLYRQLRRVESASGARLRAAGRDLLNFSSNDYLGLSGHPRLREAAWLAAEEFGAGAGASRLICGSLAPHHELEEALAAFKGVEAALSFSSGYTAALGALGALLGPRDIVILDRLAHACLVDAARLCGAQLRVFAHNEPADLEKKLAWAARQPAAGERPRRVLVVVESLYSMDGDYAPLPEIVELKDRYGAWLLVDEAHATGLRGRGGRGLIDEQGLAGRVEIQMGTLGKALGSAGGFIAGSRALVDLLVNRARSFIFSTASAPAAAAAAQTAVGLAQSPEGDRLRERLWRNVEHLEKGLAALGKAPARAARPSPILPLVLGAEAAAVKAAEKLLARGILIPAIRYPAVARGRARLRVTVSAAHEPGEVARLLDALKELGNDLPDQRAEPPET